MTRKLSNQGEPLVEIIPPDTRVCRTCSTEKPLTEFSKLATGKYGYRHKCLVCHNLDKQAWASQNKETRLESSRKYYWQNRDYYLAANRAWLESNREQARSQVSARRKRVKQATPSWLDIAALLPIYKEAQKLGMEVDHIVPINHPHVCGLHVPWNLQLLSHEDNLAKGNRFYESNAATGSGWNTRN